MFNFLYKTAYAQNIEIPNTALSDVTSNASSLISELSPIWTLILGVLLAAVTITLILKALR